MDWARIRQLYPITSRKVDSKPLIYMDHAASTHAPKPVLDTYMEMMENQYANVHRGKHELSCVSTDLFEEVPEKIANFIGVKDLENNNDQVVLTTNTTSALDLASHLFSHQKGAVLSTIIEHHSNYLPHKRHSDTLLAEINDDGRLDLDDVQIKLEQNDIKLLAVSAGSNVTGYMPPIHELAKMAHNNGAKILIDAAQRLAHYPLDVKPKDHPEHIDFVAGGGHKFYAPMGSSFLYGDKTIMDEAPPYIPSGGTVAYVSEKEEIYLKGPDRHQFGTPNIAGAVALGKALEFLSEIGMKNVRNHELDLLKPMLKRMQEIENIDVLGDIPIDEKLGVISFNVKDMDHNQVSHLLDKTAAIATRNGCFCAGPYMHKLLGISEEYRQELKNQLLKDPHTPVPGAVRASLGIYNNNYEVNVFLDTIEKIANGKIIEDKQIVGQAAD